MNAFLFPGTAAQPDDMARICLQRVRRGYANPATILLVACPTATPNIPVGSIQALRPGTDDGAKRVRRRRDWCCEPGYRITNKENLASFLVEWMKRDREKYWSAPERQNLWVVQNLMVDPEMQGKGIGKLLMADIIERQAEIPKVVMGLTSNPHGGVLVSKAGVRVDGRLLRAAAWREGFYGWAYDQTCMGDVMKGHLLVCIYFVVPGGVPAW
ncbi:hypothetical protein BJ878DRAFT_482831 [Calycina marina]|uniref:N-acetyltransferase domain-containing protein n=1 Tax=Calycina marina TaxID=1763456 RepID=A0A9P8CCE1_9HELO|nr:hypothetical protein BJ878DRAFT_482831 [Calycina marina]